MSSSRRRRAWGADSELYALYLAHERNSGGMIRWEHAHGVHFHHPRSDYKEAICQWCGKTVAYEVEFNPRRADSSREATLICHGLVEYHLTSGGCERGRDDGYAEEGQLGA